MPIYIINGVVVRAAHDVGAVLAYNKLAGERVREMALLTESDQLVDALGSATPPQGDAEVAFQPPARPRKRKKKLGEARLLERQPAEQVAEAVTGVKHSTFPWEKA